MNCWLGQMLQCRNTGVKLLVVDWSFFEEELLFLVWWSQFKNVRGRSSTSERLCSSWKDLSGVDYATRRELCQSGLVKEGVSCVCAARDADDGARVQQHLLLRHLRARDAAQDSRIRTVWLRKERVQCLRRIHRHPQVVQIDLSEMKSNSRCVEMSTSPRTTVWTKTKCILMSIWSRTAWPCCRFDRSIVELIQGGEGGLSVLRTFRLLRILKLVRFLPALRYQLVIMLKTMDNVATFFALLILFIFIFRWVQQRTLCYLHAVHTVSPRMCHSFKIQEEKVTKILLDHGIIWYEIHVWACDPRESEWSCALNSRVVNNADESGMAAEIRGM